MPKEPDNNSQLEAKEGVAIATPESLARDGGQTSAKATKEIEGGAESAPTLATDARDTEQVTEQAVKIVKDAKLNIDHFASVFSMLKKGVSEGEIKTLLKTKTPQQATSEIINQKADREKIAQDKQSGPILKTYGWPGLRIKRN